MAKTTKKPGKALIPWEEQLAKMAEEQSEAPKTSSGNFISFKSGQMSYKDAPIEGNSMNVVILDHILENQYYADDYDSDAKQPPACYAFARKEADLKPHEEAEDPQHAKCAGCLHNEWGSADRGRGKACKNVVRLQLISEADLENIENAEVAYVKISVTNVSQWAEFLAKHCENKALGKRPSYYYITEMKLVPDAKTQFKVLFKAVGEVEDQEMMEALYNKRKELADAIMFPYPKASEMVQKKPAKTSKFSGKGKR